MQVQLAYNHRKNIANYCVSIGESSEIAETSNGTGSQTAVFRLEAEEKTKSAIIHLSFKSPRSQIPEHSYIQNEVTTMVCSNKQDSFIGCVLWKKVVVGLLLIWCLGVESVIQVHVFSYVSLARPTERGWEQGILPRGPQTSF